jgi:hypothetical protein
MNYINRPAIANSLWIWRISGDSSFIIMPCLLQVATSSVAAATRDCVSLAVADCSYLELLPRQTVPLMDEENRRLPAPVKQKPRTVTMTEQTYRGAVSDSKLHWLRNMTLRHPVRTLRSVEVSWLQVDNANSLIHAVDAGAGLTTANYTESRSTLKIMAYHFNSLAI